MKTLPLLLCATASWVLAADLTLTDGRVFREYTIASQTPGTVLVRHEGGAAKVEKALLPDDVRALYPLDGDAAEREAREAAAARETMRKRRAAVETRRLRRLGWPAASIEEFLVAVEVDSDGAATVTSFSQRAGPPPR